MSDRTIRALGRAVWLGSVGLAVSGPALVLPHRALTIVDVPQYLAAAFTGITFATVGGFLVDRRPRHTVAWLFLAIGFSQAFAVFALYGTVSIALGGRSGWMDVLAWMETWTWEPGFVLIPTLLLQLFPTGRPLTPRWSALTRITIVAVALGMIGLAFHPQISGSQSGSDVPAGYRSPVPATHATDVLAVVAIVVLIGCVVASVVSIAVRYHRSRAEEREQLKWFVAAATGTVVFLTGGAFLPASAPAAARIATFVTVPLIPVATAVAILKYRLYDIDVVINKTLVFGALAAFITVVYVAIVVGIGALVGGGGQPNLGLSILATAVVALAFQPVRARTQHLANRFVYGRRATPYEVLTDLARGMGAAGPPEDLLPSMARTLGEGTGAEASTVWLRTGDELRPVAAWPEATLEAVAAAPIQDDALPRLSGADAVAPVRLGGALLGAVSIRKAPGDRVAPAESRLLADLASQAGLVIRNVGLTEELRARMHDIEGSRERIIAARDQERGRLERAIEHGARRRLEELSTRVAGARAAVVSDPGEAARLIAEAAEDGGRALDELREVARGVYPPLLADQGLAAALAAQARRSALQVRVRADGVGRHTEAVEAAVYFCVVEALRNAAAHAEARAVDVRVSAEESTLVFSVADDGRGFDPRSPSIGSGLVGMTDRLAALGGELSVESVPGAGTTVRGWLPARAREDAA
jgi:signal transduction histidine kinase